MLKYIAAVAVLVVAIGGAWKGYKLYNRFIAVSNYTQCLYNSLQTVDVTGVVYCKLE